MAGWITIAGQIDNFEDREKKFRDTFNVQEVPKIQIVVHPGQNQLKTIAWAWNQSNIPDIYVKENEQGDILVLCGIITEFGRFGSIQSDQEATAEKLLNLWTEYHEEVMGELNGSFSCLFYDARKNETSVFTDRYASKSVWFVKSANQWILGNFPSAIATVMAQPPKLNPSGLWSLLHAGRHVGNQGLYTDMRCLMAGEIASLHPDRDAQVRQWKSRRYIPETNLSAREWGERITGILINSGQRYKNMCANPFIFLSGGLDSRVAAAAFGEPLKAITLCNSPNAETRLASLVTKAIGIDHEVIVRSPYWYLDTLDAASLISAGNFLTYHTHFTVPVSEISSRYPDAEFLFGSLLENFNKFYFSPPADGRVEFNPEDSMNILLLCISYLVDDPTRWGVHFRKEIREALQAAYLSTLREYALSLSDVSEDPADCVDTFMRWSEVGIWPAYNMITGLWPFARERNIVFDNAVYDLGLSMPSQLRGAGIIHRWTLHYLNKKLPFIPNANTFLPPVVPIELHHLAKKVRPTLGKIRRRVTNSKKSASIKTSGSWVMMHHLCRQDKRYMSKIEEIIYDKNLFPDDIFDSAEINNTWREYTGGNMNFSYEIQALLSFGSLHNLIPTRGLDL